MNKDVFEKLPVPVKDTLEETNVTLCAIGKADREINTLGEIVLSFKYVGHVLEQNLIVSSEISDACILGWDAIRAHGFVLAAIKAITFRGINSVHSSSPLLPCLLTEQVALPGWSAKACPVKILAQRKTGMFVFSPRKQLLEGVQVDSFVMEGNDKNKYFIQVRNFSPEVRNLARKFKLGHVEFDFEEVKELNKAYVRSITAQNTKSNKLEPVNADTEHAPTVTKS